MAQRGKRKDKVREVVLGPESELKCIENVHMHTSFHFKDKPDQVYSVGGFLASKNKRSDVSLYDFVYKILAIGEDYTEDPNGKDRYYVVCQFFRDARDHCVPSGGMDDELLCTSSIEEVDFREFLRPMIVIENDEKKGADHDSKFQYRYFSEDTNQIFNAPPSVEYDGWKSMYKSFAVSYKSRFIPDHPSISKFIPPFPYINNVIENKNNNNNNEHNNSPIKTENNTTSSQTSTTSESNGSSKNPSNIVLSPEVSSNTSSTSSSSNNNNSTNTNIGKRRKQKQPPQESPLTPQQKKLCNDLPKIDNPKAAKEQQEWLAWLEKEPSTSSVPPHIEGWFGVLLYRRGAERLVAAANTPPSFYLDNNNN